jgi:putative FmdB family regulatory protein
MFVSSAKERMTRGIGWKRRAQHPPILSAVITGKGFIKEKRREMPIYEFECLGCGGQFQSLIMKRGEMDGLTCPGCEGQNLKRLISSVTYHQSEQDRINDFDPTRPKRDAFYGDSRNIGLQAKKRAQQMGCSQRQRVKDPTARQRIVKCHAGPDPASS